MSDSEVHEITIGAVAASHAQADQTPRAVAPTGSSEKNTLRERLVPLACWRGEELLFDFDSSFVKPDRNREIRLLKDLRERHKRQEGPRTLFPPLSVFGHADPTGNDEYNKQLSGRRASAIYGLLVRDTDLWEKLYSQPLGRDDWGTRSIERMLKAVGNDPGPPQKELGPEAREAVKAFQASHGLAVDGKPGKETRKALFAAYMDQLCGEDFKLDKKQDFLARGDDVKGKGDFQGCSDFNPVLLFSQEEKQFFDQPENHDERDAENEPNRRVLVFLFRPGARVSPKRWPCPRADEPTAACRRRFWSDAKDRRASRESRREHPQDRETFSCRFYDRLAGSSPCEVVSPVFRLRLYDKAGKHIPFAPFRIQFDGEKQPRPLDLADAKGFVVTRGIPAPGKCTIEWGPPLAGGGPPQALEFKNEIFLRFDADRVASADQRLQNLGFSGDASRDEKVIAFKKDHPERFDASEVDGRLTPKTLDAIEQIHDGMPDDARVKETA
jgi:hypothetical protein